MTHGWCRCMLVGAGVCDTWLVRCICPLYVHLLAMSVLSDVLVM